MKLRVGIVGCGKFADVHVQQVQVSDSAEVVAVCDLEPLMARQMAVRCSLPAMYSDLGRMLTEQRLDVLHITTPPASHPALGSIAMEEAPGAQPKGGSGDRCGRRAPHAQALHQLLVQLRPAGRGATPPRRRGRAGRAHTR